MAEEKFIFEISPYEKDRLLPQVSKALEKRTEMLSREQYPGLWRGTDRLRMSAKGNGGRSASEKSRSLVRLAAGVFLIVPGLVKPEELKIPLLAGAAVVILETARLWNGCRNRKNPFDKSAELLLTGKTSEVGQALTAVFSDKGMTISADEEAVDFVPYGGFECAVETADSFLLVYGERITLLQKKDLKVGTSQELSKLLSEQIPQYWLVSLIH